mmetsp:Transcript_3022/g.3744  ORF Transcript_3022/g.3744 Transcript_3022/m.3744 type:complete len:275 (-) Transcript_3022:718-1542(-)
MLGNVCTTNMPGVEHVMGWRLLDVNQRLARLATSRASGCRCLLEANRGFARALRAVEHDRVLTEYRHAQNPDGTERPRFHLHFHKCWEAGHVARTGGGRGALEEGRVVEEGPLAEEIIRIAFPQLLLVHLHCVDASREGDLRPCELEVDVWQCRHLRGAAEHPLLEVHRLDLFLHGGHGAWVGHFGAALVSFALQNVILIIAPRVVASTGACSTGLNWHLLAAIDARAERSKDFNDVTARTSNQGRARVHNRGATVLTNTINSYGRSTTRLAAE